MATLPLHERIVATLTQSGVDIGTADKQIDSDVTDWVSTQAASLNYAIGRPGIPVGRLTTVVGAMASGKSTLAVHLLAETQRRGGVAVLIDAERRYSRDRAERIGINHEKLIYMNGETLEGTFETVLKLVDMVRDEDSDALITIVWDSIAGSPTEKQLKGEYMPAEAARIVSTQLRELHPKIAKRRISLVIVNQHRNRLDMGGGGFMNRSKSQNTMIADNALSFWSSLKLSCSSAGMIGEDRDRPVGMNMRVSTKQRDGGKNTVARPERTCLVPIDFNFGIDVEGAMFEAAKDADILSQSGSWWVYGDHKFQSGKWHEALEETDIAKAIEAAPTSWQIDVEEEVKRRAQANHS